jgi:hypothetical protein
VAGDDILSEAMNPSSTGRTDRKDDVSNVGVGISVDLPAGAARIAQDIAYQNR